MRVLQNTRPEALNPCKAHEDNLFILHNPLIIIYFPLSHFWHSECLIHRRINTREGDARAAFDSSTQHNGPGHRHHGNPMA